MTFETKTNIGIDLEIEFDPPLLYFAKN